MEFPIKERWQTRTRTKEEIDAYPDYPFIKPATYAEVAELLANADKVFIY